MSRFGRAIQTVRETARSVFQPSGALLAPQPRAQYMRDGKGRVFGGWNPSLREPAEDVQAAYEKSAARTTDLMHNLGWIAGGIDQAVSDTVGTGLRLNAAPDPAALGMDPTAAAAWAKLVEQRFRLWASRPMECDVEGRRNFGQMQAAAFTGWFGFGEIVAQFPWRERPGCTYGTKVRLLPPFRLSQKTEVMGRLVQGVRMDPDNCPVSYVFEFPDVYLGKREVEVPARDNYGRPNIIHVFDGSIGHLRGISPMVPVLRVARQYDQLANATLMAAIVQSLFAASIESSAPTEEIIGNLLTPEEQTRCQQEGVPLMEAWLALQEGWYKDKHIDVGIAGRIAHTAPGDKLEFHNSATPGPNHAEFAKLLLRENARCMGITYEGLTGDYAGVTFSSIRFATDNIFRIVEYRRKNVVAPFCQAAYEAWLEEEIDRGGPLAIPGGIAQFVANRAGICNATWKGTPKPTPDELKRANADKIDYELGVRSLSMICEDRGVDYDDVCAERGAEIETRAKYNLPEPPPPGTKPAPGADPSDPAYKENPPPGSKTKEAA